MKHAPLFRAWAGAVLATAALPAVAHHGTLISYDRDQQWTRDAVVTSFRYANPHPQLFFDVTDDRGGVEHWASEMLLNPSALVRIGWTKVRSVAALAPGTAVKITIAPARAGGPTGLVLRITDAQGVELLSEGPSSAPPAAPAPAQP